MSELRLDFLNLQIWATRLSHMLEGAAHEITDTFGNPVSVRSPELCSTSQIDLTIRGKTVAKLRAPDSQGNLLKPIVEGIFEAEMKAQDALGTFEASQLISSDIDSLLDLSEADNVPFEEQLKHMLRLVRAHVWAERSSVFGMIDGFTLEGLAGIGWPTDEWKTLFSTAAGVAASTRLPYIVEDPAQDEHLKGRPGIENIRNLICFPLIHGETVVGVLNISNRVGGSFSEPDRQVIQRFGKVACHLLQKFMFKTRMQDFERTNDNLGKYLSKKVVKNVEDTGELQLGGVEKKVVCLFSDIRGYTSITEGIKPALLVSLLNFHFERMHAVIEKHEGTLDKIVGDLVMAVWNIPKDQPEPELLAMKAALEMQKEMKRTVIPEWHRHGVDRPGMGMGVGVNSGLALVGNLGSSRFMNYTVIGDAVNTAQRLESKAGAGEVWMNAELLKLVEGKLEKPYGEKRGIHLKGKEQTIDAIIYKPLHY